MTEQEYSFADCVRACLSAPEFVDNWQRLRGVKLATAPIDRMIDAATGHDDSIARLFLSDVHDLVYSRLSRETS